MEEKIINRNQKCKTCGEYKQVLFEGECMICINTKKDLFEQVTVIKEGIEENIQTIRTSNPEEYKRRFNEEIRKNRIDNVTDVEFEKYKKLAKRKNKQQLDELAVISHADKVTAEWNAVADMMVLFFPNGIHKNCNAIDYKILGMIIHNLWLSVKE